MKDAKKNKLNNAGGGHYNHCMFWTIMGPKAGGAPSGVLAEKIDAAFGSFDEFKDKFAASAAGVFGWGGRGSPSARAAPSRSSRRPTRTTR